TERKWKLKRKVRGFEDLICARVCVLREHFGGICPFARLRCSVRNYFDVSSSHRQRQGEAPAIVLHDPFLVPVGSGRTTLIKCANFYHCPICQQIASIEEYRAKYLKLRV